MVLILRQESGNVFLKHKIVTFKKTVSGMSDIIESYLQDKDIKNQQGYNNKITGQEFQSKPIKFTTESAQDNTKKTSYNVDNR